MDEIKAICSWPEGEVLIINKGKTYELKEPPALTSTYTHDGKGFSGHNMAGVSFEGWLDLSAEEAIRLGHQLINAGNSVLVLEASLQEHGILEEECLK